MPSVEYVFVLCDLFVYIYIFQSKNVIGAGMTLYILKPL